MAYTINANAKNVWIRDNEDTRDLSIQTDASSVYLDNGRTLEQELGEGSMVSNVATVDSAMSKIIDGTLDGAYESCKMYGRSLVNVDSCYSKDDFFTQNIEAISDDGYIHIVANGSYKNAVTKYKGTLKPNTKYLVIVDIKENTLEGGENPLRLFTWDNSSSTVSAFAGTQYGIGVASGVIGTLKYILTTVEDLANTNTTLRNFVNKTATSGAIVYRTMVVEYQEGMENWDIPFFRGICDVKMPILRNVGKNLFDKNTMKTSWWINQDGVKKDSGNTNYSILVPATQNKVYSVSFDVSNRSFYAFLDKDYNTLLLQTGYVTKTAPQGTKYLLYYLHNENIDLCGDIQLEEATAKTAHEDHKTNILHTPETVTLRSLPNGVRDELNLKTGEYIKRIGEVTLDGSENWKAWESNDTHCKLSLANYPPNMRINGQHTTRLVCDKLKIGNDRVGVVNDNFMASVGDVAYTIIVGLELGKLTSADVAGFKQWLKENPLTVQYELAEPITTKVTLAQSEPIVKIGTELPNGVCDTYNLLTGEHIQRVGKVVLDGSEAWTKVAFPSTNTTHCHSSLKIENLKMPNVNEKNIVSDRFQTVPQESYNYSNEEMYTWRTGELLYVNILRSRLATSDVQGLKAWFKENPTTVWYELKNPIVTKKNGLPNTHGITLPNGEVDKYNESTGEYTQNLGKVVLDGSQDLGMVAPSDSATYFVYHIDTRINEGTTGNLIFNTLNDSTEIKTIVGRPNSTGFNITFVDQTINTVDKAKNCLASNPVEIYYPLATSKTIDIPLINVGQVLPNGVCDTYNPITKEYVKRLGSIVLNGDEDWNLDSSAQPNTIRFRFPLNKRKVGIDNVFGDRFKVHNTYDLDEESVFGSQTSTYFYIRIARSRLATQDLSGFKAWLKANPLTVWYELEAPQTTTVDLDLSTLYSSNPIAYENGHIILESGHDGQSLLPTLEYSTVTNRVKQIENIGEQVLRQEKQLTMLEQMLIQNIIGLDYNNTVLALNLEINEVM